MKGQTDKKASQTYIHTNEPIDLIYTHLDIYVLAVSDPTENSYIDHTSEDLYMY